MWPLVSNFNPQKSALLQVIRALDVIKLKLYGKYTQQMLTYLSLTVSCLHYYLHYCRSSFLGRFTAIYKPCDPGNRC